MHWDECATEAVRRIVVSLRSRDPLLDPSLAKEDVFDGHNILLWCEKSLTGGCAHCCEGNLPIILYFMEQGYPVSGGPMMPGVYPWDRGETIALLDQAGFSDAQKKDVLSKIVKPSWLD